MIQDVKKITLVIASPSDTTEQRDIIESCCYEWNKTTGEQIGAFILPKRWETDVAIRSNTKYQQQINEQIIASSNVLIALFWTSLGSKTSRHQSGTIEEIKHFANHKKPFLLYRISSPVTPDKINPSELNRLNQYIKKFKTTGALRSIMTSQLKEYFTQDIGNIIDKLLLDNRQRIPKSYNASPVASTTARPKQWFEKSIHDNINDFFSKHDMPTVRYYRNITFLENCLLWKSITTVPYNQIIEVAKQARTFAFNSKYGNYNYKTDLRSNYKKEWFAPINQIVNEFKIDLKGAKIIDAGSNSGTELFEIFPDYKSTGIKLQCLDISDKAIERWQKSFSDIEFISGNMEESPLKHETYDVYLNLRAIHSNGVDLQSTLSDARRILKPHGLAIISISNGYLVPDKSHLRKYREEYGMWENRTGTFVKDRPYRLAIKIKSKMDDYGFKNTGIIGGHTEIFVFGTK